MEQRNSKNECIDLSKVLEGYENKWIIISEDYSKIIKAADSIDELKGDLSKGIVMLVPDPHYSYIPALI